MNKLIHLLGSATLLLSLFSQAQAQVLSPQVRERTLERESILFKEPVESIEQLEAARDPFTFYAPPVEKQVEEVAEQAATALPQRISDEDSLRLIAQSFTPKGSLISGTRRLLVLPQGQNIPLGTVFSATINEQVYE